MPIKTIDEGQRRFPRLGKIRLGVQVANKSGRGTHPEQRDYFVTDDNPAGAQLRELFGEQPRQLPITFPSDDLNEYAEHWYELWGGGGLKCRGDGARADAWLAPGWAARTRPPAPVDGPAQTAPNADPATYAAEMWADTKAIVEGRAERADIRCLGEDCPMFGPQQCGPSLHLRFIVRGYPGLGVFQLDSGSVMNIQRVLDLHNLVTNLSGGRIAGVPIVMSLEPVKVRNREIQVLRFDVEGGIDALTSGQTPALHALPSGAAGAESSTPPADAPPAGGRRDSFTAPDPARAPDRTGGTDPAEGQDGAGEAEAAEDTPAATAVEPEVVDAPTDTDAGAEWLEILGPQLANLVAEHWAGDWSALMAQLAELRSPLVRFLRRREQDDKVVIRYTGHAHADWEALSDALAEGRLTPQAINEQIIEAVASD